MLQNFYYIIVGGGLSGLQLALALNRDVFFRGKQIAIIEPSPKSKNDKTWCFWEKGSGNWDDVISKSWSKGKFSSSEIEKNLDLGEYQYKMLRSADFYRAAIHELEANADIHFIKDEISNIDLVTMKAKGKYRSYSAVHFFDSRMPANFSKSKKALIHQHFKGWFVETEKPIFNPSTFTMMDFRLKWQNSSSFTYVLPLSETKALIEFTFFTPFLTDDEVYDEMLKKYITDVLKIEDYQVLETEKGNIPMTDFQFQKNNSEKITKIGTAGGWVKASTGYSFKSTEKKVEKIVENLKKSKMPGSGLINKKFSRYDAIFLDVLDQKNELGEQIFQKLYTKNAAHKIFGFLDEETNLKEDLEIMQSMYKFQFVKSFFRKLKI